MIFVYFELWPVKNIKSSESALTIRSMITYCSLTKDFAARLQADRIQVTYMYSVGH